MSCGKEVKKPKFSDKKDYRPDGVAESDLAFVGHEISGDGTKMNQLLHYDQLYTIRHGRNSPFFYWTIGRQAHGHEM